MAKWFARRPVTLGATSPIISFTFDDFPRTALFAGGSTLEQSSAAGTFFVAHGLAGQSNDTGELFVNEDLPYLLSRGHELGYHTFHHYPAWNTPPDTYNSSVDQNALSLAGILGGKKLQTHSYPINYPRPDTKRRLAKRF